MVESIKNILLNVKGFRSKRKIVVIESDDWGSVRMPSVQSYNALLAAGIRVDQCGYNRFDSLENADDLTALYDCLSAVKDQNGNTPVITANTIVANPDYAEIRAAKFERYAYETVTASYQRYQGSLQTLDIIKQGMVAKMYFPQLHGREHIFIKNWMRALESGDEVTRLAFDHQVYGLSTTIVNAKRKSFLTALDLNDLADIQMHEVVLKEAQELFQATFGFKSTSFIAANYTWHPLHEALLHKIGVDTLQGSRAQKVPDDYEGYKTMKHYMGDTNSIGQLYLIRNAGFEPSTRPNIDWQAKITKEVQAAFLVGAPVVLSTHRVNFMGGLEEQNRTRNLELFGRILADLVKRYPDIEFMNTVELANHIRASKK